ncbi:unnamed protein product [Bursaphelenchus xylophilus]|uniref:(pine wood nematode) hypothetical protein n=1 Tax=Bursaphelenchus xylophilus TaxID=6326 RepID=A0A1I7SUS3_BURXY|nr:unnamed protein product [Bursaphelenchus xylophilus]CAG9125907.1 unnamed protein product [Bursaphelenchus xylophilus]
MGCCCSKHCATFDESAKEGVVPVESIKNKNKFPEDTEPTQRSENGSKFSLEGRSSELVIDPPPIKPKADIKHSKDAKSAEVAKKVPSKEKHGPIVDKKSERRSASKKEVVKPKVLSKQASSVNNTDREYQTWYHHMRKRFTENTEPTQPEDSEKDRRESEEISCNKEEDLSGH